PLPADKQADVDRLVAYLAPTLPTGKSLDTAGVKWGPSNADGPGDPSKISRGTGLEVAGDNRSGIGLGRKGNDLPSVDFPDIDALPSGKVYVDAEVDREVQRDPTSAAPEYPPYLMENRIEGSLTVEFVVDTTGSADSTSLKVIHSSHPAFEQSLRTALPHMRFVPAELGGRLVRQWVRQEFRFLMPDQPAATM
ncbi:MAG TPA: energy transducer TonB, partial [Gemmatimonadaceae bacterium]|nr:energy transducer TonB [Gemmatimonadaceae bacterium]